MTFSMNDLKLIVLDENVYEKLEVRVHRYFFMVVLKAVRNNSHYLALFTIF